MFVCVVCWCVCVYVVKWHLCEYKSLVGGSVQPWSGALDTVKLPISIKFVDCKYSLGASLDELPYVDLVSPQDLLWKLVVNLSAPSHGFSPVLFA